MTDIKRLQHDILNCYVNGALAYYAAMAALEATGVTREAAVIMLHGTWAWQVHKEHVDAQNQAQ